jgi:electron transfer flavoprotein beta subunit
MNIVVTVKQVIDPNLPPSYLEVDPEGRRVTACGVPQVMNGYDANALEVALRLKEQHGGRVAAVCLGNDSGRATLKRALAMGADTAILLDDPAWLDLDSAATGEIIAAAIRKIGACDLVLCGRQASDTDGGQVLYWIAERLGLPAVCPVSKIESADDGRITLQRLTDEGYQRVRVRLPALLGISSEANEPRTPSLKGTMTANRMHIAGWKAADLPLPAMTPKVELRRLEIQLRTARAALVEGDGGAQRGAALADKLHAEGLI